MDDLKARADWARDWLLGCAFEVWSRHGRNPDAGFFDRLGGGYAPSGSQLRMRVQARQLYVYVVAGRLGWQGPWRDAAAHAAALILDHGVMPGGLVHSLFDLKGAPQPAPFDLYDQAFAMFALGHAWSGLGLEPARAAAEGIREAMLARLARPDGGFQEDDPPRYPLRANPHMHLYEAALSWMRLGGDEGWGRLAAAISDLAQDRFLHPQTGRLLELFEEEWTPAEGPEGRICEPGHQFEWGWLMLTHAELEGREAPAVAAAMIEMAARTGVDRRREVAFNTQDPEGEPLDVRARLWPQTERLKAALAMRRAATGPKDSAFWTAEACRAFDGLKAYLDIPEPGLWRDVMLEDGSLVEEAAPASSFYHIVCAFDELMAAV